MIKGKMRTVLGLGLIFLFAIILQGCGSGGGGEGSEVKSEFFNATALTKTLAFTQLVINDVDEDEEGGTLTIIGVNFDNGYEPVVSLDDEPLTLISYTANIIVVSLPVSELSEDFVITVKTGDGMENYDFYSVTQDDEDPVPLLNRLVVFGPADDSDESQDILNIRGQNFDNGYWPPDVMLNDIPLDVDVANSNSELLVLVLPDEAVAAITNPTGGVVLTVQTGASFEQYDSYELVSSSDFDDGSEPPSGTEFDCSKRHKVPSSGEHWCTTAGQTLRWKTGPIRTGKIPHYFELMEDYEIDIMPYFNDYKDLPNRRTYAKKKEIFDKHVGLLEEMSQCSDFATRSDEIKWDYLSFVDGKMKIKKGYRWDGESRPGRTLGYHMRAAFIHDTFYDLVRLKYIPCTNFTTDRRKDYQHLGDTVFYFIAREAGQGGVGARSAWRILRDFGWSKAKLDIEQTKFVFTGKKHASWRFHTLADAAVWGSNASMYIDDEGNKSLEMTCAAGDDEIELDAGNSRPLAEIPKKGIYQDDIHETTWEWTLNGASLAPMNQNHVGVPLDFNDLKMTFTVNELLQKGLLANEWGTLNLKVDVGKDNSKGYHENEDVVAINVAVDNEPPVITGISEPINGWPPNHKYVTFTVADFVTEVTDNCSTITLDDLVITQVTSDEPDEDKGDGHTHDDIMIAQDGKSVDLRIERQGTGDGRVYTIHIKAVDDAGNTAVQYFQVHVPHSKHGEAIDSGSVI